MFPIKRTLEQRAPLKKYEPYMLVLSGEYRSRKFKASDLLKRESFDCVHVSTFIPVKKTMILYSVGMNTFRT